MRVPSVILLAALLAKPAVAAQTVNVRNSAELAAAFQKIQRGQLGAGTIVLIAPGTYNGGYALTNVVGKPDAPIVIRGTDPKDPPIISGGGQGFYMVDCAYITLSTMTIRDCNVYAIHIHDGGTIETPAHHIVLENLTIENIRSMVVKMAGVDDFTIRNCRMRNWKSFGIAMVGCHKGVIEDCTFGAKPGGGTQTRAILMKGGSSDILVQTCFFNDCGKEGVEIGGMTGERFFRPAKAPYEARKITVAGNRFYKVGAPVSFAAADGGHVHHNTIVSPRTWVMRILQTSNQPRMKPCRDGVFEKNLVVYEKTLNGEFVNVGPRTAPKTFKFKGNAWFQSDGGGKKKLPSVETGGVDQVDPKLEKVGTAEMRITSTDPRLKAVGADAYLRPGAEAGDAPPPKIRPDGAGSKGPAATADRRSQLSDADKALIAGRAKKAEAELRAALIAAVAGGARKKVYVTIAGRPTRVKVTAADEKGLEIDSRGMVLPLPWKSIAPARFARMCRVIVGEKADPHLAWYALHHRLKELAAETAGGDAEVEGLLKKLP